MILKSRWLSGNESAAKRLRRDGTVRTLLAALLSVTSWPSVCCLLYLGLPASCCPPHPPATLLALSVRSQMDVRGGINGFIYQMLNGPGRSNGLQGDCMPMKKRLGTQTRIFCPQTQSLGRDGLCGKSTNEVRQGMTKRREARTYVMLCLSEI